MKNGKFTNTIIRMQYVPRWSEHAPRFEDNASAHSFRCAALSIMIGIIEEKVCSNPLDKLKLLGRCLWGDLNNTGTGSIKHVTKKESLVMNHIRSFEQELSKEIVSYLSKSLQEQAFDFIVNAQDDTYIGRLVDAIDTLDAYLFCHRESRYDSNPFFHAKYKELEQTLADTGLASVIWLLEEYKKQAGLYDFIQYIVALDTVQRWNGSYNLVPDNDATHSFRVASLALFNGLLERERFGNKSIDLYKLLAKATLHDLPEALSGDVVSNFKHNNPDIKLAFEQYEKETALFMINKLPELFHADMLEFIAHSKSDDYVGEMVDIADKLDALIKASLEMRNNPHYADTYYNQLLKVQHRYENPCVIFFLAYTLHDLTYSNLIGQ
ncbi:putative hydrolase of HD superfamily [Paenibacillus endophyticus]|uniref:Putative hydrolase of HD superfamily n=1 Tax=Paenibacillus endophyticus TaxID=1294268 RepID=A0A7W5CC18_9BACL|nr:YfbR-like 5'-deoxynucleotidase [Paenibacillus endophyticus]MBB3154938.1 putative hydrolase of HD superfamily [Paenibacillus endophyticus]